jgi:DNA primase
MDIGVDTVHQRLTFPLRDLDGVLVGISGRDYTNTVKPKYKVYDHNEYTKLGFPSHETHKSHLLWNGHLVYPRLFHAAMPIVVVEGFKACMKVLMAGCFNVVAILGNQVSDRQRWQLERMATEIWLWLDNNQPGMNGSVLSGMSFGAPVRIVPYPDEREQPSDLSTAEIQLALSGVKDFTRWLLDTPPAMDIYQAKRRKRTNVGY